MKQQARKALMALFMSMLCVFAYAQKTIHGTVTDANGEPMIGVSIIAANGVGTVTDFDGKFTLSKVSSDTQLKVSYIGYPRIHQLRPCHRQTYRGCQGQFGCVWRQALQQL